MSGLETFAGSTFLSPVPAAASIVPGARGRTTSSGAHQSGKHLCALSCPDRLIGCLPLVKSRRSSGRNRCIHFEWLQARATRYISPANAPEPLSLHWSPFTLIHRSLPLNLNLCTCPLANTRVYPSVFRLAYHLPFSSASCLSRPRVSQEQEFARLICSSLSPRGRVTLPQIDINYLCFVALSSATVPHLSLSLSLPFSLLPSDSLCVTVSPLPGSIYHCRHTHTCLVPIPFTLNRLLWKHSPRLVQSSCIWINIVDSTIFILSASYFQ